MLRRCRDDILAAARIRSGFLMERRDWRVDRRLCDHEEVCTVRRVIRVNTACRRGFDRLRVSRWLGCRSSHEIAGAEIAQRPRTNSVIRHRRRRETGAAVVSHNAFLGTCALRHTLLGVGFDAQSARQNTVLGERRPVSSPGSLVRPGITRLVLVRPVYLRMGIFARIRGGSVQTATNRWSRRRRLKTVASNPSQGSMCDGGSRTWTVPAIEAGLDARQVFWRARPNRIGGVRRAGRTAIARGKSS